MDHRLARIALVLAAFASLLAFAPTASAAPGALAELTQTESADDDLDTTAIEWSGATYNASTNVLLTVDDEQNAYEIPLLADGTVDATATPRVIDLDLGSWDFEGVAWVDAQTYAFLSEGAGEVIIATVPETDRNGTTTISEDDIDRRFDVISGSWGNLGPEGLATDGDAFYVTREIPATVSKFANDGTFISSVDLVDLDDASGVAVLPDDSLLVISHESNVLAHYEIDWNPAAPTASLLETRDAGGFTQLEGIAINNDTDVYLFGEDNTRKGNPGQTFSHLVGDLVAVQYAAGDVNCSGTINVADALLVAQIRVKSFEPLPECGTGDHNSDGVINIADALMVAQCAVGVTNVGCPSL